MLQDALAGELKPIYNHLADTPNIAGALIPLMPEGQVAKNISR